MEPYYGIIEEQCLSSSTQLDQLFRGELAFIGGFIEKVRPYQAKNGKMAFLSIDWRGEKFDLAVFAEKYTNLKMYLDEDAPVIVQVEKADRGAFIRDMIRLDMQ